MPSPSPGQRATPTTASPIGGVARRLLLLPLPLVGAALLQAAVLAPSAGLAASVVRTLDEQLLDYPPIPEDLCQLAERSVVLDRDGNRLAIIREENRVSVSLDEVPEHVRQAVIATEDREFYAHEGVSWRSVVRAAAGNLRAGEVPSGASTLTQQLVKNLILESSEQSLDRKLQEAVYALELEQRMSKDEILESYLNTDYFGNGTYGIGAAAELYRSKAPAELTVADAALLAGLLRTPQRNDPIDNEANALARRAIVRAHLDADEEPLGALTSIDPQTGEVLAIGFGPRPFGSGPGEVDVNPAVPDLGSSGRQSGSAFKAFEVVAALEAGVSPALTIDTPSPPGAVPAPPHGDARTEPSPPPTPTTPPPEPEPTPVPPVPAPAPAPAPPPPSSGGDGRGGGPGSGGPPGQRDGG